MKTMTWFAIGTSFEASRYMWAGDGIFHVTTANHNHQPNKTMKTSSIRIVAVLFAAALLAFAGIGCHTAHGFGHDVKDAGQGIENHTP